MRFCGGIMNKFTEFYNGNSVDAYKLLGCHKVGENRYHFAVWAPNAKEVSVIGDFNNWLVNHDKWRWRTAYGR